MIQQIFNAKSEMLAKGKSYGQQFCFPYRQCQEAVVLIQGVRSGRRETHPPCQIEELLSLSLGHAF